VDDDQRRSDEDGFLDYARQTDAGLLNQVEGFTRFDLP
jgi:hypothetical protein